MSLSSENMEHLNETDKMEANRQMYVKHSGMRENEANATFFWRIQNYDQAIQYLSEEVKSIESAIAITRAEEESEINTNIMNEFIFECIKLRRKIEEYEMKKISQNRTFW